MASVELREYQQRAIDQLYDWFKAGNFGNPCLVLPTGAGKSHIVAALCKDALTQWPETRILMLTHVKELIEQNAEKMRQHWPGAPLGIYSASLNKKQLGEPITFAGIQSIAKKSKMIGHVDLIIIDECHLVSHKDQGGYRSLIKALTEINPALRVVGLTATPYRLGHGLITDEPAIFNALVEPVIIEELVYKGFLSNLRSKLTREQLDVSGVHKRGGEYIESELQAAVDNPERNHAIAKEVISMAGDRKAWLFFCAGVVHAEKMAEALRGLGVSAQCVTGYTLKKEREEILSEFKAGKIRALTNANVLTTGFDYPDIDLIAMLRPTMSPGLYVQMAGRGLRVKSHTDHCLVLDFAGAVSTHGPITAVNPPNKKGAKEGPPPVKVCSHCGEICALAARVCSACGAAFPAPEPAKLELRDDDIMGTQGKEMAVSSWMWRKHISKSSGKPMVIVTYYGELLGKPITEYLTIGHGGIAGEKAMRNLYAIASKSGAVLTEIAGMNEDDAFEKIAVIMTNSTPPSVVEYKINGKFYDVIRRNWSGQNE